MRTTTNVYEAARHLDHNGYNCEAINPNLWQVAYPNGTTRRLFNHELIALAQEVK